MKLSKFGRHRQVTDEKKNGRDVIVWGSMPDAESQINCRLLVSSAKAEEEPLDSRLGLQSRVRVRNTLDPRRRRPWFQQQ